MAGHKATDRSIQFPILQRLAFFNHAGVAPISGPAAAALRRYADQAEQQDDDEAQGAVHGWCSSSRRSSRSGYWDKRR